MTTQYMDPGFVRGGGCSRCLRGDHLIDCNVGIDFEGPLALCTGCVRDIALLAGFRLEGDTLEKPFAAEAPEEMETPKPKVRKPRKSYA